MLNEKIDEILSRVISAPEICSEADYHVTYLNKVLKHVKIPGMWLEFGVYRGRSMKTIASNTSGIVYGFDSFEGLPDHWDNDNPKGCFNLNGKIPHGIIDDRFADANPGMFSTAETPRTLPWPENVVLIKGWFEDTLPPFLLEHTEDIAYLHIDSDVYSAAKTVLNCLKDRIKSGTIIDFDEICDYPSYREHEIKAFAEFLLETNLNYECLVYQRVGYSQAAFRIL